MKPVNKTRRTASITEMIDETSILAKSGYVSPGRGHTKWLKRYSNKRDRNASQLVIRSEHKEPARSSWWVTLGKIRYQDGFRIWYS